MASIKSLKNSNQSWILLKTSWSLEMSWKKWEYCTSLLLGNSYTFKNVDKTFHLKACFSFHSSNFLFIIISPTCSEEYTGETGIGKTKLKMLCWSLSTTYQSTWTYQATWLSKTQGRRTFEITPLPFLYLLSKVPLKSFLYFRCRALKLTYVGESQKNFMKKYKTKLNNL